MRCVLFLKSVFALTLALCAAIGSNAHAAIIAEQNFDIIGPAYPSNPTPTTETLPMGSVAQPLTHLGATYDGSSPIADGGLTFRTLWTDTRGNAGPLIPGGTGIDTTDFIGVNSFSGGNAPVTNAAGVPYAAFQQYNYEFNDADGQLDLVFDPVDTSGFGNRALSLNYWINATGFEPEDSFSVSLSDGTTSETVLSLSDTQLEALGASDSANPSTGWNNLSVDLEALGLGDQVTLTVTVDNNASAENIFIDDVQFTGDVASTVIPEPASATLLAAGLLSLGLRRRRVV